MSDLVYNLGHQQTINPGLCNKHSRSSSHRSCVPMPTSDHIPIPDGYKRCTRCQELRLHSEFHKESQKKDGLRSHCKNCVKQADKGRHKRYYAEHRTDELRKAGEYQKANREKKSLRDKERYRAHREEKIRYARQYYKEHQEEIRDRNRRYQANNKGSYYLPQLRRRTRKRQLPVAFTDTDTLRVLNYFGHRCAVCGRPPGLWHTLAMDHWIPLTDPDCPGTIPTNMVPLCHGVGGCNNSKHNKKPQEWLVSRFEKRKALQIAKRIEAYFDSQKENGIDD